MHLRPVSIVIMDNKIAIKWNDDSESFISNKVLREKCPCANCSGETDIFGNVYKNEETVYNKQKNVISHYINIGHYAIRFFWGDGHDKGIYSFDFIKSLKNE